MYKNTVCLWPNQKTIIINLEKTRKSNVVSFNRDTLFNAMKELKPVELKVYIYLGSWENKDQLPLSPKDISDKLGGSIENIKLAVNSLIEKGYIIQRSNNRRCYDFYQVPLDSVHEEESKGVIL